MKSKTPDRLFVRKRDLDDFKTLVQEKDSPFYKRENKTVFLMAMILGYCNNERIDLDKKEGFIRAEYLSNDEKSLIKAIAIKNENDLKVLLDKQRIYSIAEEYAAGGIKHLKESVFGCKLGSYVKQLESDLVNECEKLGLG